ncbi:hypothetical protein JCM10207_001550 [Rhodosporidiobolus poonsookiae]
MSSPAPSAADQAALLAAPSPAPPEVSPAPPQLALPAPPQHDDATKLEVGGESVSLYDRLGPTVVNSDGTLSRIANWTEMTEPEKKRILRVLGARNQIRLEAKKAELGVQDGAKVQPEGSK